jgi:hypothetical protein
MRGRLALVLVLAAALVAGCGGGGNGGAPSADEFRQQADAVCAKYEQKLNALGEPASPEDLADFVDKAVPIIEQGNAELNDLDPPDELQDDWDRAMDLQNENLETTRDLRDAVRDNDPARIQELVAKLDSTTAESNRLAENMGLDKCGEES